MTEVQSCFLPSTNIQFAWDSTSLGYMKTCPRLYQYIMIDGWGSGDESVHLRFGGEYHSALQEYDISRSEGLDHEAALRITIGELLTRTFGWTVDEDTKAGKYKNRRTLIRAVIDYLDQHKDDAAKTHILDNSKPAVELSFRFELDWGPQASLPGLMQALDEAAEGKQVGESFTANLGYRQPYLLCGHLDRVVEYQESLFVMDHKTTTTTPGSYFFDQFAPNNQMTLYTIASKVILDAPVKGVIISAAQLMVDSSRFVRGFTFRTGEQLEEWLHDLKHWLTQAEHYATINYWPQNDTACDKFGGCRFREICSKSPGVREQYLKSKFTKLPLEERWNPLKPR